MVQRALGRRPHDPNRPVLKIGRYLNRFGFIPQHLPAADHLSNVSDWGMYDNDRYGVCGPTALANQRKQVTKYLTGTEMSPSQDDVFDLYRRSGNPDFDPNTGAGDNGVILADMLSAAAKGGFAGTAPLAYAAVNVQDPDEVRAAIDIFGSLLWGVDLDVDQQEQTDANPPVWDYVRYSRPWGGHCVLAGAYTGDTRRAHPDCSVVSWAEIIGTTDDFAGRQLAEAWVVIWPEHLGNVEFEQGVNLQALAADYTVLTGRPFPTVAPTPPPPPPDNPPSDPDAVFKQALAEFITAAQTWEGSA